MSVTTAKNRTLNLYTGFMSYLKTQRVLQLLFISMGAANVYKLRDCERPRALSRADLAPLEVPGRRSSGGISACATSQDAFGIDRWRYQDLSRPLLGERSA